MANDSKIKVKKEAAAKTQSQLLREVLSTLGTGATGWDDFTRPDVTALRGITTNPTLIIARVAARVPGKIGARDMSYVSEDPERAQFVKDALASHWQPYVNECLNFGVDYGFQAFEIVWRIKNLGGVFSNIVPEKIKPLLADITEPRIDVKTGEMHGVKNGKTELDTINSVWFSSGNEANNPYGAARLLAPFPMVQAWNKGFSRLGKYVHKVSSIIPMIEYPTGSSVDATGADVSNYDVAAAILAQLGEGHGVSMPNVIAQWAEDLARTGQNTKDLRAWSIDFLEPKGNHGKGLTEIMNQLDKWILRAYLVPERAIIEGVHGTKADAETHSSIIVAAAEESLSDVVDSWNQQVVDKLLVANFGEDAAGTVKAHVPHLIDENRRAMVKLVDSLVENESTLQTLARAVDLDTAVSQTGLKVRDGISINEMADDGLFESLTATLPDESKLSLALSGSRYNK